MPENNKQRDLDLENRELRLRVDTLEDKVSQKQKRIDFLEHQIHELYRNSNGREK